MVIIVFCITIVGCLADVDGWALSTPSTRLKNSLELSSRPRHLIISVIQYNLLPEYRFSMLAHPYNPLYWMILSSLLLALSSVWVAVPWGKQPGYSWMRSPIDNIGIAQVKILFIRMIIGNNVWHEFLKSSYIWLGVGIIQSSKCCKHDIYGSEHSYFDELNRYPFFCF